MKTDEELERMAYINGHTEIAELLARVIDAEAEIEAIEKNISDQRFFHPHLAAIIKARS